MVDMLLCLQLTSTTSATVQRVHAIIKKSAICMSSLLESSVLVLEPVLYFIIHDISSYLVHKVLHVI